jgi:acetolactate synthase regulatory subunit
VIEVACEARDAEAIERLVTMLEDRGFRVERNEID